MEKQYYDLIISLIKDHRKYSGLEPILEDIANDVYEHAAVVINSVSSEEVIKEYLRKVVSTSIITVPKKMNFNTKIPHRQIVLEKPKPEAEPIKTEPEIETSSYIEQLPVVSVNNNDNLDLETTSSDNILSDANENLDSSPVLDELSFEDDLELENDNNLSTANVVQAENLDLVPEDLSEDMTLEENEVEIQEKNLDLVSEDLSEDITLEEDNVEIQEENLDLVSEDLSEDVTLEENEVEIQEKEIENDITPFVHKMINGIDTDVQNTNIEIDNLETTEDDLVSLDFQTNSDEIELDNLEEGNIEFDNSYSLENLEAEEDVKSIQDNEPVDNFSLPSYDCFSFEVKSAPKIDDEICSLLKDFDKKYPEKRMYEICDMKYNKNYTVNEISEQLDISLEQVLEVLNDIIDLVKG
jgi:hypothetical protein